VARDQRRERRLGRDRFLPLDETREQLRIGQPADRPDAE
jgi:hypothetical protein